MKDLYRENKQLKTVVITLHEKKLMNFNAKKYYIKVRLRYNNAFLNNFLKKNNRYYIFIIKINIMKIVININKRYLNMKNFHDFKKKSSEVKRLTYISLYEV